ncbi:hypothetical protein BC332_30302 [Capsicum chinense]|nr:hypothetical protein BC332_30302 [Capsicum chinense]
MIAGNSHEFFRGHGHDSSSINCIIRGLVVHLSVVPSNTMSVEPNQYQISKLKVEEDRVSSQNLATAEAEASIDTKVLNKNEKNGNYCYGFETDGMVDMDQLENLNGAILFPAIHIGSPLTGS